MRIFCVPFFLLMALAGYSQVKNPVYTFEFYGDTLTLPADPSVHINYHDSISETAIIAFYTEINQSNYKPLISSLLLYKEKKQLNDWLYYQLIRKTAQLLSPKSDNYQRYTLYKWFLLTKSGYDARLAVGKDEIIFYVLNHEDIADIPFFMIDGKKYMCLNYHDYGKINFENTVIKPVNISDPAATNAFSYKVTKMPEFKPEDYIEKNLTFSYNQQAYHFKVKLNQQVDKIFANYPVVDFETYFNIPLSRETYQSLIPLLKQNVKKMSPKNGVNYLMHFTRNAFLYENDEENFGKEKRLSPEQTLLYQYSDCDDRAALFFYLVKEIYNLPMIALLYPTHITMAVQFDKPVGTPILYKGKKYSVCEPTPQQNKLKIGQLSAQYRKVAYEVVYSYQPVLQATGSDFP